MLQLFLGSFLLSLVHAIIPNHWLPIILVGKAEGWRTRKAVIIAALSGLLHTTSTILLGGVIGYIGFKLSENSEDLTRAIASLILIFMGIIYFNVDSKHHHNEQLLKVKNSKTRSIWAIVVGFALSMFFSPCLEIETYYFKAGTMGIAGIILVSLVYLSVTVIAMTTLVFLGSKSLQHFKFHFLDHHEKKITGAVLIILGVLSYFISF